MIDWLTLRLSDAMINLHDLDKLRDSTGRILFIDCDGEVEREVSRWESIKSDTHKLTARLTDRFEVMGSPARLINGHNVFGSSDIRFCARLMIQHINDSMGLTLPTDLTLWDCGRIDITHNYDLGSGAEVRQALDTLRHTHGGRQLCDTYGTTVMWGRGSSHTTGKAYHKGPEIKRRLKRLNDLEKYQLTEDQLEQCDRLLRLELTIKRKSLIQRGINWCNLTPAQLDALHSEYFGKLIGKSIEVVDMNKPLIDRCKESAPTPGQGLSAHRTYLLIKSIGLEEAKESMTKATFYRHRGILLNAGVTPAQLRACNVVPIRTKSIELGSPINSFNEIAA